MDLPIILQPCLQMSTATASKIASGQAYQVGGVVREVGTGRLVELLDDAPDIGELAEDVAAQLKKVRLPRLDISKIELPRLNSKTVATAGGVLLVAGVAVGGFKWFMSRRTVSEATESADIDAEQLVDANLEKPECLTNFRTSLQMYVDSGAGGALTSEIVGALVTDLDAIQKYSEEGHAIVFTLDELMPFFELVTAHTPLLAETYDFELDGSEEDSDGVVLSLRRHLEVQKRILDAA